MSMSMALHDYALVPFSLMNAFVPLSTFSSNVPFFAKHDFYYRDVFLEKTLPTFPLYTYLLSGRFFCFSIRAGESIVLDQHAYVRVAIMGGEKGVNKTAWAFEFFLRRLGGQSAWV